MAAQENTNTKKTNSTLRSCCSGCLILFLLALAVILFLYYLGTKFPNGDLAGGKKDISADETKKYEDLYLNDKPAPFVNSMPSDYQLSPKEEEFANSQINKITDEGKRSQMKQTAEALKKYYPEGYFILVKNISLMPADLPMAADLWLENKDTISQTHIFLHEYSHFGESPCFFEKRKCPVFELGKYSVIMSWDKPRMGYWIEDKSVSMKIFERSRLISGKDVLTHAKKPPEEVANDAVGESVRKIYLDSANQTIDISLDEINSYMKNLRFSRARAYQERNLESALDMIVRENLLAQQLYIASLHLKVAKENFPQTWSYMVKNKAFAYVLMKMMNSAEKEIRFAQEEGVALKKSSFGPNVIMINTNKSDPLKSYEENRGIIDTYFSEAKVSELRDKDLTLKDLSAMGISVSRY